MPIVIIMFFRMAWLALSRTKCKAAFGVELEACTTTIVRGLCIHYESLKNGGVDLSTYLELYGDQLELVLDATLMQNVKDNRDDLAKCADDVVSLCNANSLGKLMFHDHVSALCANTTTGAVNAIIATLHPSKNPSAADIDKAEAHAGFDVDVHTVFHVPDCIHM